MDKEHTTNMIKMAASMETLSTAVINGFATLRPILQPQQANYNRGWYPYLTCKSKITFPNISHIYQ